MDIKIDLSANARLTEQLYQWWAKLDKDKASRAMLRRCATLDDISLCPAYQRLHRYLVASNTWPADASHWQNDKLAAIVGLLSHVKTDNKRPVPASMYDVQTKGLLVSELRFRSLLKVDSLDDLYTSLRRVLPLMNHAVGVQQLANDLFWWGDKTKKEWAYAYPWPTESAS